MAPSRKILLCGATGFIGRNLLSFFAEQPDTEVTAVWHKRPPYNTPKNVTWQQADLRNPEDVARVVPGHTQIIQAAATTSGAGDIVNTPYIHVTDNAVMNSYMLRAAFDAHIEHFVFFSCSVMYPSSDTPVSEEAFNGEIESKYIGAGWTKLYIERMCEFFAGLGRTKHTVIRHSNIYGPHDKFDLKRSHFFGASVSKAMLASQTITIWGTGEEKRDLLHVDDLVAFVSLSLDKQSDMFALYNCGSGEAISVNEVVEKIVTATGKSLECVHDLSQPTIPFSLALDCSKARAALDWQPNVSLDDGIRHTVQWWQQHIDPNTLALR